ncbi:hypothetical protein FSARC_3984 [Fusarium sarcochroum]|uniref:Zn(2)-C6 fungal-type domain-containing protein n=1 Tax=Fusarium sarcochroum TaxID=1208366 RepID=A0A8H4U2R6_9HYPO|nr:hypothetical protein FSARC_3984 [Fusarium sarcochroum]
MPNPDLSNCTATFRISRPQRIKRNRATVSCSTCRTSKLKCDKQHPCGTCQKRGQEDSCRFEPTSKQASSSLARSGEGRIGNELKQMQNVLQSLLSQPSQDLAASPYSQLFESVNRIQNAIKSDNTPEAVTAPVTQQHPDVVFGFLSKATLADISVALPPRQVADRTVSTYFNAKHIAVPFIHTHQFRRQYEAFWSNPASTNLLWVSILFSVLAIGSIVPGAKATSTSSSHDSSAYVAMSARCLVSGQYHKAAEFSVEALTMHLHSCCLHWRNKEIDLSQLHALVVRLAQQRFYHCEVNKLLSIITPFEAEMRRRVWYFIQYYDVLFSLEHGLPPLVHEDTYSTGHPTNVTDDEFDEDTKVISSKPMAQTQHTLLCVFMSQLLPILRRIIRHAQGFKTCTYLDAMSLKFELDTWPFLDLMRLHHKECQVALDVCRKTAVKSISVYVEVDCEMQQGGRLQDDQHIASSLPVNDFLMMTIVAPLEFFDCGNLPPGGGKGIIETLQTAAHLWSTRSFASAHALESARLVQIALANIRRASPTLYRISCPVSNSTFAQESEFDEEVLPIMQQTNFEEYLEESSLGGIDPIEWNGTTAIDWDSMNLFLDYEILDQTSTDDPFLHAQSD